MDAGSTAATIHGTEPPAIPVNPHAGATKVPPEGGWGRLSWRKIRHFNGGADGTRTRDPRRDRPVWMSASMNEDDRVPHDSGLYLFSFALAHLRCRRDGRKSVERMPPDPAGAFGNFGYK